MAPTVLAGKWGAVRSENVVLCINCANRHENFGALIRRNAKHGRSLQKRDELRDRIKSARSDLKAIEAAIRVMEGPQSRQSLFKRGNLKRLVCDAVRGGAEGNGDIAIVVVNRMGWEVTDERVRDITTRVKDETCRL